jgi:hypothetical protein
MSTVKEDYWTGRVTFLGTGIADLGAAKKYLRDKFGQTPLEPVQPRLGRWFYVSGRRGGKTVLLLGPFVSHMTALSRVPAARERLQRAAFVRVGTCASVEMLPTRFGR